MQSLFSVGRALLFVSFNILGSNFCFLLFQSHYHSLPYPKGENKIYTKGEKIYFLLSLSGTSLAAPTIDAQFFYLLENCSLVTLPD